MNADLPEDLFANPVWHALHSGHRRFAVTAGAACRYPADVVPFVAVGAPGVGPLEELCSLLEPGEQVWLIGENHPPVAGLVLEEALPCLQLVLPAEVEFPAAGPETEIVRLSAKDAPEMVDLTDITFPGFFRARTCEMGAYYGVRSAAGDLIAMGGERMLLDGYPEISAICTHPDHRGKGLAAGLIRHLARNHRREGLVSWMHVGSANRRAIELYRRLGFREVRAVVFSRFSRVLP